MLKTAHARQGHSPQNMLNSSAPSSENQDRTTVPRAGSSSASSSENQDRTTVPRAGSSYVLSSENQDRTTVPRARSTVLPLFREPRQDHSPQSMFYSSAPLQRSQTGPQSLEHVLQFCPSSEKPEGNRGPMEQLQERLWVNMEDLHQDCRTDQVKTCSNAEKDDDNAT